MKRNTSKTFEPGKWILYFMLSLFPLILYPAHTENRLISYAFGPLSEQLSDTALYGKMVVLLIASVGLIFLTAKKIIDKFRKNHTYRRSCIILLSITICLILSTLMSVDRRISFLGINEQFESIFVLLSYILLFLSADIWLSDEKDFQKVLFSLSAGILPLSLMGFIQFIEGDAVASTLYNPNYVGSYASLVLPMLLLSCISGLCSRLFLIPSGLLLILLILSSSQAGIIGTVIGTLCGILLIYFNKYIGKKKSSSRTISEKGRSFSVIKNGKSLEKSKAIHNNDTLNETTHAAAPGRRFLFPGIIILSAAVFLAIAGILGTFTIKTGAPESISSFQIETRENRAIFREENEELSIGALLFADARLSFELYDGMGNKLEYEGNPEERTYYINDIRFSNYHFNPIQLQNGNMGFVVFYRGRQWYFGLDKNGFCHTMNAYGKLTDLVYAPYSAALEGHEKMINGRGYIWSRTIPLIPSYFLLGSGPDTFTAIFPQNDMGKLMLTDFQYADLTMKPHSLYLQILLQLGAPVLILVLTLILLIIYNLVVKRTGKVPLRAACLGAMLAYLITALINDSTICVTPVAAILFGLAHSHRQRQLPHPSSPPDFR
ncbi:MAG: O-antigen ligase family protein [Lachnospiraceae bacterium]|nr:O-antigen ligase family protein [Lachnospiraceae bacterium]